MTKTYYAIREHHRRKPAFVIRSLDSIISINVISNISWQHLRMPVWGLPGRTIPKPGFLVMRLNWSAVNTALDSVSSIHNYRIRSGVLFVQKMQRLVNIRTKKKKDIRFV